MSDPKMIASHQRIQHFCFRDKSVIKKFMCLDSPEDIEKWREERKANFPTKVNIEMKKAKQSQQMINSLVQTNQNQRNGKSNSGRNKRFNRFDKRNKIKRKFNRNYNNEETEIETEECVKSSVSIDLNSITNDVKRTKLDFKPTNDDIEDGEIVESDTELDFKQIKTEENKTQIVTNNKTKALNLLSAYDSDEESESDSNEVTENSCLSRDTILVNSSPKMSDPLQKETINTNDIQVHKTEAIISDILETNKNNNWKQNFKKRSIQRKPTINTRNRKLTLFEKVRQISEIVLYFSKIFKKSF